MRTFNAVHLIQCIIEHTLSQFNILTCFGTTRTSWRVMLGNFIQSRVSGCCLSSRNVLCYCCYILYAVHHYPVIYICDDRGCRPVRVTPPHFYFFTICLTNPMDRRNISAVKPPHQRTPSHLLSRQAFSLSPVSVWDKQM